jgi:hypothetical protein
LETRCALSGHGAEFQQAVTSMQLDHVAVETASPGTEVAIQVDQRSRKAPEQHATATKVEKPKKASVLTDNTI